MVFRVRAAAWMPLPVAAANCLAWGAFGRARLAPTSNGGAAPVGNGNGIKAFGGTFSLVVNPWQTQESRMGFPEAGPIRLLNSFST